MNAFIAAVAVALVIAVVSWFALETQQQSADVAFSTVSTRVGDPGHNLIASH